MSESKLTKEETLKLIIGLRVNLEQRIGFLQNQINNLIKESKNLENLVASESGLKRCTTCDGFGKVERMDAGYMKRFGLREWNGCKVCGGDGNEIPGCGFVAVSTPDLLKGE